jgi:MFS family permease
VLAGLWADRWGREKVAGAAMAVSGACALSIGWLGGAPPRWCWARAGMGFAVVADSAQFSALVTEVAPPHAVGTALTLQTSLGFLLTAFTIWLTFVAAGVVGWGVAFSVLAVGPAFGIWQRLPVERDHGQARTHEPWRADDDVTGAPPEARFDLVAGHALGCGGVRQRVDHLEQFESARAMAEHAVRQHRSHHDADVVAAQSS